MSGGAAAAWGNGDAGSRPRGERPNRDGRAWRAVRIWFRGVPRCSGRAAVAVFGPTPGEERSGPGRAPTGAGHRLSGGAAEPYQRPGPGSRGTQRRVTGPGAGLPPAPGGIPGAASSSLRGPVRPSPGPCSPLPVVGPVAFTVGGGADELCHGACGLHAAGAAVLPGPSARARSCWAPGARPRLGERRSPAGAARLPPVCPGLGTPVPSASCSGELSPEQSRERWQHSRECREGWRGAWRWQEATGVARRKETPRA